MRRTATLALVLVTLAPGLASAQSMAELAAREREKKKNQKPTTKVITDEDLRRGSAGRGTINSGANEAATVAPAASASPGASAAAGAEKPKTEDELRAEAEKAWREKLAKAQAEVQRISQALEATNRNLGDMSGNLYGAQRTNLLAQAEKLKAEQQAAQQQVEMLQEEGRRSRYR